MKRWLGFLSAIFVALSLILPAVAADIIPPTITSYTIDPSTVYTGETFNITVVAEDNVEMNYIRIVSNSSFGTQTHICLETPITTCTYSVLASEATPGTYYFRAIAVDTSMNSVSSMRYLTVESDTEKPVISNVYVTPDPATYAPGQVYTFYAEITDNAGITDAEFEINGVVHGIGELTVVGNTYSIQFTDLPAGDYDYTWRAEDANTNPAEASDTYTIGKAIDNSFSLDVAPGSGITYGTSTTATCTIANAEQAPLMEFTLDGQPITSPDTRTLSAGDHIYYCQVPMTQNYTEQSDDVDPYTVDQAKPVLHLSFNGVENDQTITYGTVSTAFGWFTAGDTGTQTRLEMDDGSGAIEVLNPHVETLAAETYIYEYFYEGSENYTTDSVSWTLTVDQATPTVSIDVDPDSPQNYGTPVTARCSVNNAEQTTQLFVDLNSIQNNEVLDLAAGDHEFTCTVDVSENYTDGAATPVPYHIDQIAPVMQLNADPGWSVTYPATITVTGTENNVGDDDLIYQLYTDSHDGSGFVPVFNSDTASSAGTYDYEYRVEIAGENYTTGTVAGTAVILPADPIDPINVTIHLSLSDGVVTVEDDLSVGFGTVTTAAGWKDFPDGTLTLYLDGTDVGSLTDTRMLPIGVYNYTLELTSAQNYLDGSVTRWLTIGDNVPPVIMITWPVDYTANETWLNATTDEPATCYFGPAPNPTDPMTSAGTDHSAYLTGLPEGENTYYVRCSDASGNTAEESVTWTVGMTYIIEVEMGWNLISLPIIPYNPVLTSDTSIWGTNYIIQHYDAPTATWLEYDSANPGAATLSEVVPDQGYWTYVDTQRELTFLGEEPGVRTVQLYIGMNHIGWTALEPERMDLALYQIIGNVSEVQCQDISDITVKLLRTCNISTEYFEPGKGYFITAINDSTWIYPMNIRPVADAGLDREIEVGDLIALDGTGSYDRDGSVVSYSWAYNGVTLTGPTPEIRFGAVGTYTIVLTVTDNEGATATDEVVITVKTPFPNGGGGGGGNVIGTPGLITITLDVPETVTVIQGQPATFTATVTNTGNAEVYDIVLSSDPAWITADPDKVAQLSAGQAAAFTVTLTLPDGVIGTNHITVHARGSHPNATVSASATIEVRGNPAQCANCSEPTDWTTCTNGTQTRKVWTCDEENNYECTETIETRPCSGITGYWLFVTDNPVLSAVAVLIMAGAVVVVYLYRKGKLRFLKNMFAAKAGKKQGIDYSIDYKK